MTAVFADPFEEFLAQDPSILREPTLTEEEAVIRGHGLVGPAIGIGAAYLVYRGYMSRQIKKETQKQPFGMSRKVLKSIAVSAWQTFVPSWVRMTAPYIAVGYIEGAQAVATHEVPEQLLQGIAQDYAKELGNQLNETSLDAVLSGYQAQVNRKVPSITAAQRVADAYGVTQRPMNTLVNVWTGEDAKILSDQELPSPKVERARMIINTQNNLRARKIGDNEHWATRTQGKQVVWMYGVEHGIIPIGAQRRWITAADEKVCPTCGPMSGVQAPVKEKFKTNLGEIWTPPSHVNCRCDVLLDMDPYMTEELNNLLEAESVTKAMGSDRYDRSANGRFARTESRRSQMEEDDENFQQMLRQVNRALAPPRTTTPVEEDVSTPSVIPQTGGKIENTRIEGGHIGGGQIRGGKIGQTTGSTRIVEGAASTKIAMAPTKVESTKITGVKVTGDKIPIKPNPGLQVPAQKITDQPIETLDANWHPLGYSLVSVLSPAEFENRMNHDGVITMGLGMEFFEKHSPQDVDADNTSLNRKIHEHWANVIDGEVGRFHESQHDKFTLYKDPATGLKYHVDSDAYYEALIAAVYKTPQFHMDDEGEIDQEDTVTLRGTQGHKPIEVNTGTLANKLGLQEFIEHNRPILVETKHAFPLTTQQHGSGRSDVWTNPGAWVQVDEKPEDGDEFSVPYIIVEVEPTDFPEPTDLTWPRSSGR